ncbi:MAG: hypothetical protein Q7S57_04720 [bacterium]|nr:hypothetical protein [bacterium]
MAVAKKTSPTTPEEIIASFSGTPQATIVSVQIATIANSSEPWKVVLTAELEGRRFRVVHHFNKSDFIGFESNERPIFIEGDVATISIENGSIVLRRITF